MTKTGKQTHPAIFIVHEREHVDEARRRSEQGSTILCFDFLIERELNERGIPFASLGPIMDQDGTEGEWYVLSHKVACDWYRIPSLKFFEYKGIRIAEPPEPSFGIYLARLFYYARVFEVLKKKYPAALFFIPRPPVVNHNPNSDPLAIFHPRALLDAARLVGLRFRSEPQLKKPGITLFPKATWRFWLLRFYNFIISLFPRRRFKIYASAYWNHVAPIIPHLTDTELLVFESQQFYRIPWRQILKHRLRVLRSHDVVTPAEERWAVQRGREFEAAWLKARPAVAEHLSRLRPGLDWSPVLEACAHLVAYSPRVIADIDTLEEIMKKEKPDLVLQLASVGGPHHYFFLLASVARRLGITSVELQHAGATIDPRSVFCRLETDYLLTYGPWVNVWHQRLGHDQSRLIAVGSPRFDTYVNDQERGSALGKKIFAELGLDPQQPVLLAAVPASDTFTNSLDSYQLAEFFEGIRAVQKKVPGLQILFKWRTDRNLISAKDHLRGLFGADVALVGDGDIFSLVCASDAVVCNNSTLIYQAILAGKPLILCAWKSFDTYHAQVYGPAAPLFFSTRAAVESLARIFTDDGSYRAELLLQQKRFLENYSFDGRSAARVAAILPQLIQGVPKRGT
jgi:hypothetical protein